jgi:uncharacterized protein
MKMKKILSIALALLTFLLIATPVFATDAVFPLVTDDANLLTDEQESAITQRLQTLSDTYKVNVYIVTVRSIDTYSMDRYVENYYDSRGLGYGENRDGVLLLVSMRDREYRILSNGLGADAISMSDIDSIGDTIAPYLTEKRYNTAFNTFIDECEYEIDGEINGFPFDYTLTTFIAVVLGLLIAAIVTGVMRGQLKSVRPRAEATEYAKQGSLRITKANEFFLYRTVSRRRRPQSSSGSGGGSRRNVGGGRF